MACYHLVNGYRSASFGDRSIVHRPQAGFVDLAVTRPCGRCIGCRLEYSRSWAVRCSLEASLYEDNCFLTLTYNKDSLPKHGHLDYEAPQLFMKRLRAKFGADIRSFGCAEYGKKFWRPHYHLLLFNFNFFDRDRIPSKSSFPLYKSDELSKLWPFGYSSVSDLTFESAAYVSRYCTKKRNGADLKGKWVEGQWQEGHYTQVIPETGEVLERPKERSICVSNRPGIGAPWFMRFFSDVYPLDEVVVRGHPTRPPRYFDKLLDEMHPELLRFVKTERRAKGSEKVVEQERRNAIEFCKLLKTQKLERSFEDDSEDVFSV